MLKIKFIHIKIEPNKMSDDSVEVSVRVNTSKGDYTYKKSFDENEFISLYDLIMADVSAEIKDIVLKNQ